MIGEGEQALPGAVAIATASGPLEKRALLEAVQSVTRRLRYCRNGSSFIFALEKAARVQTAPNPKYSGITMDEKTLSQVAPSLELFATAQEASQPNEGFNFPNSRFSSVQTGGDLVIENDLGGSFVCLNLNLGNVTDMSGHPVFDPKIQYRVDKEGYGNSQTLPYTDRTRRQLRELAIFLCEAQAQAPLLTERSDIAEKMKQTFQEITAFIDRTEPNAKIQIDRASLAEKKRIQEAQEKKQIDELKEITKWCADPLGQAALIAVAWKTRDLGFNWTKSEKAQLEITQYQQTVEKILTDENFQKRWNSLVRDVSAKPTLMNDYNGTNHPQFAQNHQEVFFQEWMKPVLDAQFPESGHNRTSLFQQMAFFRDMASQTFIALKHAAGQSERYSNYSILDQFPHVRTFRYSAGSAFSNIVENDANTNFDALNRSLFSALAETSLLESLDYQNTKDIKSKIASIK